MLEGIDASNKFILAGGINQSNIKAAISMNPWCIDVNSGVESGLAIKNELLMTKLMNAFNNG
jgi:phosphoribosylanthranilate isomerase